MNRQIVIIGASGHGKVIADIARKIGYTDIVFLDDNIIKKECSGFKIVGLCRDAEHYKESYFVVGIGDSNVRKKIQESLSKLGLHIKTLIHPDAVVSESAIIGEGTVIMAGAVVNPCAEIGKGCIINTCSSVDHDCVIGDFTHVSVGSHIAGNVSIGERTLVGAGATVINNISIVSDCIIGAGAVVVNNLLESSTYIGVPAKKV